MVKTLGKEEDIDRSYYDKLVNDAIENISQYGDFEWFVSDDPYISKEPTCDFEKMINDIPWYSACGKESCFGCPHFTHDPYHIECLKGYDVSDIGGFLEDVTTPFDVR